MRIIQISDSHVAHDIPQRLTDLESCVQAVNKLAPDLVIHTGDITHNGLAEEYQQARVSLDKLQAPYFVLNGNKDSRELIFTTFTGHDYLHQGSGYLQYSIEKDWVRLLVIDTVRESTSKGELCEARMDHLTRMLEEDSGKPVLIFMHHSPFVVEEIPDPHQFHDWSDVERFSELLSGYRNIKAIYCGHVHRDIEGAVGSLPVQTLCCIATDLRKGKLSDSDKTRPMHRIIDFNR